jgi:protein phosphatase
VIIQDSPHLVVAAGSHTGKQRQNNEDRFAVRSYRLDKHDAPILLAVVADGIGGHLAGEVAAQLTVETLLNTFKSFDGGDPLPLLKEAVVLANQAVAEAASDSTEQSGMGSTIAVAVMIGSSLHTATVGDSRIYLLRSGQLRQISIDHTWVQEAIEYDIISPDEARDHPQSHVLRRHIGGEQPPDADFRMLLQDGESEAQALRNQGVTLNPGDQVLLCTDGLTDLVEDQEIHAALTTRPPELALETLTELALQRGGRDNITMVILATPLDSEIFVAHPRSRGWLKPVSAALLLVLITLVAMAVIWWFGYWPW